MNADLSLMNTPEFSRIVRLAWERPLLRREFDTLPLPEGADREEAWQTLKSIRRAQGFQSPDALRTNLGSKNNWHTIPESLRASLQDIAVLTQKGSELDLIAHERRGRRFITQVYIEEILTSLHYDGYTSHYEAIRSVLMEERDPESASEIIATNFHHVMQDLNDYNDQPFSSAILHRLYDRLVQGVSRKDVSEGQPLAARGTPRSPLESHYVAINTDEASLADLESVAVVAQQQTAMTPASDPIMTSMLVNC